MHPVTVIIGLALVLLSFGWNKLVALVFIILGAVFLFYLADQLFPSLGIGRELFGSKTPRKRVRRLRDQNITSPLSQRPEFPASKDMTTHSQPVEGSDRPTPFPQQAVAPTSGLIIKPDPLQKILNGSKTWEMRSISTSKRGPIALIEKGGRRIVGVASIMSVQGPLSDQMMQANVHRHGITPDRLGQPEVQKLRFAWVLGDVKALHPPVSFAPRNGAVRFVNLNDEEQREIRLRLQPGSGTN